MRKCAGSGATENRSMRECFQNRMGKAVVSSVGPRIEAGRNPLSHPVRITESCEYRISSKGK